MNTATDDHRYLVTAPWGDQAYGDTRDEALQARRTLAQDARDNGQMGACVEDITILDRGPSIPEDIAA